jgi:photosystem II stability/assembly factor-like uncharacterized protein
VALVGALAMPAAAGINRWTSNGPDGGIIAAPVMDPRNTVVFAASSAGLFRSRDGGQSWSLANNDPLWALATSDPRAPSLAIQPTTLNLFAALGKSADGGSTWQEIDYPDTCCGVTPMPVIVPDSPETFLVVTGGYSSHHADLFKSTDSGATWTLIYEDPRVSSLGLPVISRSGLEVYLNVGGFAYRDLIQSHDFGLTWSSVDGSGLPFEQAYALTVAAVDPFNPNVVYGYFGERAGSIYRSTTGGGHWVDIGGSGLPVPADVSEIVVDPSSSTTLYVSTGSGLFRSLDGGTTWQNFSDGLPPGRPVGLAIDASGHFLHVGAGGGVYDIEIAAPCVATANSLCFLGGRFIVTVEAVDPRSGRLEVGTAVPQNDRYGYFSLPGFTGDPSFPEIVVKMADATSFDGGFWVFHSGLTDLQYTLSVVDLVTGRQKSYTNDRSDPQRLCGGADTGTFNDQLADAQSAPAPSAKLLPGEGSPVIDLLGRFQARLSAVDPRTGNVANGLGIPQGAKWGYFSLPEFTNDPSFPEVFVKMLDATALGGYFWVFHTGLTDLQYTLTVTDTKTGQTNTYQNDRSDPTRLCGGADTRAFPE